MTVGEGQFLLYSYITPALKAGDYRFDVSQTMTAKKGSNAINPDELPIDDLHTHVRVTAPRYQLPPDQVLSTFPPAGTEGSYGSRLPQVVIKRRTLPWERGLTTSDGHGSQVPVDEKTPWLALVLIAEGEAELRLNQDVASCVSPGVVLGGAADVAKGNCLVVRESMLEKVLPTRKDVPLLAHAREVDINDTELMMGDDDGFLAVVISNRLPVAGVDAQGHEVPVKYLACLINLEGQFDRLIPEAPPPQNIIQLYGSVRDIYVDAGVYDHVVGGGLVEHWGEAAVNSTEILSQVTGFPVENAIVPHADAPHADGPHGNEPHANALVQNAAVIKPIGASTTAYTSKAAYSTAKSGDIYAVMAKDFAHAQFIIAEPEFVFPVLLHWSFTSTGSVTFETLMRGLDSGLSGSQAQHPDPAESEGRPPLEIVETGHVGLTHRTRRGDTVQSWYRGPLLAHPSSGERLDIAHASDQLLAVIPDGRLDISLATAFEIGRLLALSRPAMVAALLRWRQTQYQVARLGTIWDHLRGQLPFETEVGVAGMRRQLEGKLRELIVTDPDELIGPPRELITPGDAVDWGSNAVKLLGQGLGLTSVGVDLGTVLRSPADLGSVTGVLRRTPPPVLGSFEVGGVLATAVADHLQAGLDAMTDQLVSNVLAKEIEVDPVLGAGVLRSPALGTVVATAGDKGAIVNQAGGILSARLAPERVRRARRPRPPDPLDELLAEPVPEEDGR
jgi:hypothetical protein